MISWTEFRLGCRGLLHLARFDAQFLRYFDLSAAGARRSFSIALLVLPFALLLYWQDLDPSVPSAGLYIAARLVGYAYGWILFPMVILAAGRLLQRDAAATGAIALYNWSSVLWTVLQIPVTLLFLINPDSAVGNVLAVVALIYSMVVEGFFLRHCLRIEVWQAAVLVAVDIVLSLYIIVPTAQALARSLRPYTHVGLIASNSAEWIAADLALLSEHFVEVPVPLGFVADQAYHLLRDCDVVLTDEAGRARLTEWMMSAASLCWANSKPSAAMPTAEPATCHLRSKRSAKK